MAKRKKPRAAVPPPPARPRNRWVVWVAIGAVAAMVVALVLASAGGNDDKGKSPSSSAPSGSDVPCHADTQMDVNTSGGNHSDSPGYQGPARPLNNPAYSVNPPAGGDHLSTPSSPGEYTGEQVPPDGRIVHSMEHGYVVIWFKPGLLDKVRPVRAAFPRDVLLVERANMDTPTAATSWGHRLLCDGVNLDALKQFASDFRNQGPEKIPH